MFAQAGVCSHLVIQSHEAVSVVVGERGLRWVCTDWVSRVSIRKTLHRESRGYTNRPKHSTHKQVTFRSSSYKLSSVDIWARYMSIITCEMSHHIFLVYFAYDLNGQYLTKAKWWLKYTKQFCFYGVFITIMHTYTEWLCFKNSFLTSQDFLSNIKTSTLYNAALKQHILWKRYINKLELQKAYMVTSYIKVIKILMSMLFDYCTFTEMSMLPSTLENKNKVVRDI